MSGRITVHPRVSKRHPGVSDDDVVSAWRNAVAIVNRTYAPPDIYAAAGTDTKGRMLEMLGIEMEDGSVLVYHAMKLTAKMARELGLM